MANDRSQARQEAATLLGVDIDHLSPADGLRVDMVSALRLVIDHEQASVLSGGSADLGKLNVAVQSLIALLPGRELPEPESSREDPRQVMWEIYKQMRERGELSLRPLPPEDHFRELEAENARLKAQLAGGPAPALPMVECVSPETRSAIDPDDVVPPSEIGECYAGIRPGPDDRPRRSPLVIDGKAEPISPKQPAASAPAKPVRAPTWDDTPNGRAWNEWRDAGGYGGPGYDRWSNRNGA
jgi:hypothetical protein